MVFRPIALAATVASLGLLAPGAKATGFLNGEHPNGAWQNGMSENGVWQNGLWSNGLWQNGKYLNGMDAHGIAVSDADACARSRVAVESVTLPSGEIVHLR